MELKKREIFGLPASILTPPFLFFLNWAPGQMHWFGDTALGKTVIW